MFFFYLFFYRTATLEDLYKQYESLSNSYPDYDGEVTGYAVQASHQPYNPYAGGGGFQKVLAGSSGFGATTGYGVPSHGGGGGGYGAQTGYSAASIGGGGGGYGGGDSGSKGDVKINLKDLFEIALTAVAFLSFGMFIMNLVMNMMVSTYFIVIIIIFYCVANSNETNCLKYF